VDERATARDRAAAGWRHLTEFFREGARHLPAAIAAFEEAERGLRRSGEDGDLDPVLIGLSAALRLRREPADARRAVALAQELLNVTRRRSGDAAAVLLRAYLEDGYRDLAAVERDAPAVRAAEDGVEACDRTIALARRFRVPAAVPHAQATKAALLRRLAAARPAEAAKLFREANRLEAASLAAWPVRDLEGRALVRMEAALALAERGRPSAAALERADGLLRQAAAALEGTGNRYLAAQLVRARARVALAADRPDALEALEAATIALRALGLEQEAREVEAWL